MNEQELKKSIEMIVEEILKRPAAEKIEKAAGDFPTKEGELSSGSPEGISANGGHDKIRSGTPMSEEEKAAEAKKADEAKKAQAEAEDKEKKDKEEKEKAEKMKKAQDEEEKKKKEEEEAKKSKKMKKSLAELADHLDDEELELVKAWREQPADETIQKAETVETDLVKSLAKAFEDQISGLKKALDEKDTSIKTLTEKVEKMASQPAYDRRSISNLETLEKSEGVNAQEITKKQVTDKLLDLQLAGKGVHSQHIAEFEATNNISDPVVKSLVFQELKIK